MSIVNVRVLKCASTRVCERDFVKEEWQIRGNYHVGNFAARMRESLIRELPEKDQLRSTFHELKHV